MAVPKISELMPGAKFFEHDDANWTPLACSEHLEDGFAEGCGSCVEVARGTIEHALAVEQDRARL